MTARSAVLAMVLALAACGTDPSSTSGANTTAPEVRRDGVDESNSFSPEVEDEDADPEDRIRALGREAEEAGATASAAALADGEVTDAERRQGYHDALDCMTSQGMEVVFFEEYEGLHGLDFTFIVGDGSQPSEEGARISTECEQQHRFFLSLAYEVQHGGRLTERAQEAIRACLERDGITEEVGDTLDEVREVVPSDDTYNSCVAEAEAKPAPSSLPVPG